MQMTKANSERMYAKMNYGFFFFHAEDGIRYSSVTEVQTCSFFFSSRRRHTRFKCDWSSDVCSSDLSCSCGPAEPGPDAGHAALSGERHPGQARPRLDDGVARGESAAAQQRLRRVQIGRASCRERV